MKKLIPLLTCILLVEAALHASPYFYLSYSNHTQGTVGGGAIGQPATNVFANIGDSISLYVWECVSACDTPLLGPWSFDGVAITNPTQANPLNIIVSQSGTYSVHGTALCSFFICLPPINPPPTPGNILCICPMGQGVACPGDIIPFLISQVPCATSYTWTLPAGALMYGGSPNSDFIWVQFTPAFTGDTMRVVANNSIGSSTESTLFVSCSSGVGIEANTPNSEFNLFPIPFSSELNISMSNHELSEIILYDIASRKLLQQKFTNTVTLNTAQLTKGMYIYEVRNSDNHQGGVVKKGKVVKE
ncbi:MAG TPA: T9SS type A sorting domain-containing protein [Bacteroidia bacterium]|nr:T9SS type A sorting domain-containing protein [Bacteroidia bacterium]